jgi:hypothetical protein
MEPTAVREYAPLPLESRAIVNIQQSAAVIHHHGLTTESKYPTKQKEISNSEKIYPSLPTKLTNFIPYLKLNQI